MKKNLTERNSNIKGNVAKSNKLHNTSETLTHSEIGKLEQIKENIIEVGSPEISCNIDQRNTNRSSPVVFGSRIGGSKSKGKDLRCQTNLIN